MKITLGTIAALMCAAASHSLGASGLSQQRRRSQPWTTSAAPFATELAMESRARRAVLASVLLTPPVSVALADTGAQVRGTPVNAFNGLAFQYRGSDFGGLKAAELSEPSIPYAEFMEKLKGGGVTFVEFMAPDGDAAYATLKEGSAPIRIGEGYPIEQHDGYSSPAFAIRAVKNAGVPYKFTVANLKKYTSSSVPALRKL